MTNRPLTKSRFKLALACPTQLYYAADREYFDRNAENDFLQALADGGYQVGEMAKFLYHPDPVGAAITIASLNTSEAIAETEARLLPAFVLDALDPVMLAEAALASGDLLIRVDILRANPVARTLEVIEVKSKSVSSDEIAREFRVASGYEAGWGQYLYDIAFQTLVAQRFLESRGLTSWTVEPKLLLVDKEAVAQVHGVHQNFAIAGLWDPERKRHRIQVQTPPGLRREDLDLGLLREVSVGNIVEELMRILVESPHAPESSRLDLPAFVDWAAGYQRRGERFFGTVSKACKKCPYRATDPAQGKSGVNKCFEDAVNIGILATSQDVSDCGTPLSIDLWGGRAGPVSLADKVIAAGRAALVDVRREDIAPKTSKRDERGMHALDRRMAQIAFALPGGAAFVLDEDGLCEMDRWEWPLHMIDFETTAPAIPLFAGMRPYETVAFQFSHHLMERDADGVVSVKHAHQWISTQPGHDPSIDFVRALRNALMPDGALRGTVFRYHNHENTVLRGLRSRIDAAGNCSDAADLIEFIDLITHSVEKEGTNHVSHKDMVDLHSLVRRGYASAKAGGSISLKHVLPAILHDAPGVARRYSQLGFYGKGLRVESLNDWGPNGQIWLTPECGGDPYRTLPPVFGPDFGPLDEMLFRLGAGDDDEVGSGTIAQGGVAMTAYNYTQFARLSQLERNHIEAALLRYCELDTLAMVILVEGLSELREGTV